MRVWTNGRNFMSEHTMVSSFVLHSNSPSPSVYTSCALLSSGNDCDTYNVFLNNFYTDVVHTYWQCEDGGGGAATGTGGRTASLRLANGRVAAQSAEHLPHSPDCASVRISMDNTNTCCTDSLVTALDDETLLLDQRFPTFCNKRFPVVTQGAMIVV
ncbi:unnamed protein product [Pieris brassicae]|uniref:Uncharacterized protein n=1 Tax=Pieris brassicae TaxID=7116 RepID=A0A9P0XC01_PIEBR|nr:unnamed protein product [Pieris brassicae]